MIALLQRVTNASVNVGESCIADINSGLLVLLGVEKTDSNSNAERLVERILGYRVFSDPLGKMNLSVIDIGGEVLLVPQFTLAADTSSGMRPGFSTAASSVQGCELFEYVVDIMGHRKSKLAAGKLKTGQFGANMSVQITNDGPVTFWLQT